MEEETWIDYVADCGDAFDPTYAVAWHLARESVTVIDADGKQADLPRGQHLVMGGDQVYPSPSRERYINQTIEPYAHAMPDAPANGPRPQLYALPGNHDWYDGLTVFMEQFAGGHGIGGWETPQRRSYFAIPLPHGWWLWAVDVGLGGHIDSPQQAYFENLPLQRDAKIILCWATPAWCHEDRKPDEYKLLRAFVADTIEGRGLTVPLYLTGDLHHYARYSSPDAYWITAGGGGAFLHPTHHLPRVLAPGRRIDLPRLKLMRCWPERGVSRRLLLRLLAFPWYNPSFLLFTAVVHLMLAWAAEQGLREKPELLSADMRNLGFGDALAGILKSPAAILLGLLVVAGFTVFTKPPTRVEMRYRWIGAVHGLGHVIVCAFVMMVAGGVLDEIESDIWFHLAYLPAVALLGGILSGVLVGLYLGGTNLLLGMHDNEAFSALHSRRYKHFVRMHISEQGLRLYVVGFDKVGTGWDCTKSAQDVAKPPCRQPDAVVPRLIDQIFIPTDPAAATRREPTLH
jgi:hypothetical protein